MKILISSDVYEHQISGVTNSVVNLRDELINLGHDVRMLVLSTSRKSYKEGFNYYIGSKPIPVYPSARFSFKKNDKLIKELIDWKPDIVHIQTEFSTRILANRIIKELDIPYVTTCHGLYEDYICYFCPSKKIGRGIVKRLSNKYYNNTDTLVVPSNKLKSRLNEYGIKCPIEIIPTGIDLSKYQKKISIKEKKELLNKLGLIDNNKYIVSVSRLAEEKNIDELLDYMPDLLNKDSDIKLILVGDGPYKKKLLKKIDRLNIKDNVILTGMIPIDEVYKYYQLGNIFVCASKSETQGLTYDEALACSMPMVCRKDECLVGLIDNGVNGFIYETKEEFIKSIMTILNDKKLANKMGKKSFEKSNNFSKEEFGIKMEKLYISIVENNKKFHI